MLNISEVINPYRLINDFLIIVAFKPNKRSQLYTFVVIQICENYIIVGQI